MTITATAPAGATQFYIAVATSSGTTAGDVIRIDEVATSPQVATITRHVNGTTAATHSSAALVDLANVPLFAF
jgi:hypothetical protein